MSFVLLIPWVHANSLVAFQQHCGAQNSKLMTLSTAVILALSLRVDDLHALAGVWQMYFSCVCFNLVS